MTAVLTLWEDEKNGTREYEWITSDTGVMTLDFSRMKNKNDFKVYIAGDDFAKTLLDMQLMLWLGM